ncbi:MAG: mannose-1-phosphate guanylyltransferase [Sedimentisphaerales bacterium]|nr:mannose-1-phosphate guanylyltransferase [Sedimentisphaerales bacterium]
MDYAVIMAGGTGKRLWPLSRQKRPKQVLKLFDGQTLLRCCYERLAPIFNAENIIVLTNAAYVDLVRENLPELPSNNVIAEPAVRDTSGAIGLVSTVLTKDDPQATIAVVTADQIIKPVEVWQQAIKDALVFVNNNPQSMITFGIQPTFASTGLGYIKCGNARDHKGCKNKFFSVEAFKEKPNQQKATEYINSGQYFWNSGMFVWKAETILNYLHKFLPETVEPLTKIQAGWGTENQQQILQQWFVKLPKISIDFAVMEKADNVHAVKLDCRWLDMGSFAALAEIINPDSNNNIIISEINELLDCNNNIIVTEDKGHLIAAIGVENMVIAHSPDATLVCHIKHADKLKELLDLINRHGGEKFL